MSWKRLLVFLSIICFCICVRTGSVNADTSGDWEYEIYNGGVEITKYYGSAATVTVPQSIHGYTVLRVDDYVFKNMNQIEQVNLPDTLRSIGYEAFSGCTSLKSISLPESLEELESYVFRGCESLEQITVKSKNILSTSSNIFYDAGKYSANGIAVEFTGSVTSIPENMFDTSVDHYARVTSVKIGKNVKEIGSYAFESCYDLEKVTFASGNALKMIGSGAFYDCISLQAITLPAKLELINYSAFYNCEALSKITVNAVKLSDFSSNTFTNAGKASGGVEVTFANNVARIPAYMFYSSTDRYNNIKSVKIGSGVKEIGNYAFNNCMNLKTVSYTGDTSKLENIGSYAFYNCYALTGIKLPKALETVGNAAFYNCEKLGTVNVYSKKLSDFSSNTFYNAGKDVKNGIKVTFNSSVTRIPANMFSCSNDYYARVTSVTIGKNVKEIGSYAFENCRDLKTVTIKSGSALESINSRAFYNCVSLKSIVLPEKLEFIGYSVFEYCESLAKVTIRAKKLNDVESNIFNHAGKDVSGGLKVEFTDTVTTIPEYMFYGSSNACPYVSSVTIGKNVKEIGNYAFGYCIKLKTVTFAEGSKLKQIGNSAFYKCSRLKSIVLGPKVEILGYSVFSDCTSLKTVTFCGKAPNLGYDVFRNVKATVYYPAASGYTSDVREDYYGDLTWKVYPYVKVTNVADSGKIKLSWDKVSGAVKYKVYRATSKNGDYSLYKTVTGTSYTDTSAKKGKTYYYYVIAVYESGKNAPKSNIVNCTCDLARPDVSVARNSNGKPKLTWDKVSGAEEYKVYAATSKKGTYKVLATVTGKSYTHKNAVKGKTYYYKVVAVHSNAAANSAYSAVVSMKAK